MPTFATRHTHGFTLLEVLVALAVFAVSATIILMQVGQSTGQTDNLRERVFATWIAENQLADLQMAERWPSVGTDGDTLKYANQDWWVETEIIATGQAGLRQVTISVAPAQAQDQVITSLVGYVGEH